MLAGLYGSAVLENTATEPCPEAVETKLTTHEIFLPLCKNATHNAKPHLKLYMINKF